MGDLASSAGIVPPYLPRLIKERAPDPAPLQAWNIPPATRTAPWHVIVRRYSPTSRRTFRRILIAARSRGLGYPVERSNLAKLELGQRATISVPELLVVAKALDVPPLALLTPLAGDSVEILPGVEAEPLETFAWLDGTAPLPDDQDDDGDGPRAELRLLRDHHKVLADWTSRTRAAAARARADDDTEPHRNAWKDAAHPPHRAGRPRRGTARPPARDDARPRSCPPGPAARADPPRPPARIAT
ncbi:hypothetical protein ABZ297_22410 [Nonomuraea sp. NPDC005983]|uniref:hypothetical protein n=1 Tax=Nonomuraea sp. NPDC005983 TaxID=3155595 RepID=UPI0033AF804E